MGPLVICIDVGSLFCEAALRNYVVVNLNLISILVDRITLQFTHMDIEESDLSRGLCGHDSVRVSILLELSNQ